MEKKVIEEFFSYMTEDNKYVFVDDFQKWEDIDGFEYFPTREGNGLRAIITGDTFTPQYAFIRKANNLLLQFRSNMNGKVVEDQRLCLNVAEDVVIITCCEKIVAFAPVFSSKLEVAVFIDSVERYCGDNFARRYALRDCISLVKFLYRNNPRKVVSVIDDL